MKRIVILFVLILSSLFTARAQVAANRAGVSGVSVVRSGDDVQVTFRGRTDGDSLKSNTRLALMPVLTDGTYRVSLPAVIVQGKRAVLLETRSEWVSGDRIDYTDALIKEPGESFDYRAAVPFQPWMEGADLMLENLVWECGNAVSYGPDRIAANVLPAAVEEPEPVVELPEPGPKTTGDTLALTFSFVIPEAQWNEAEPVYDDDRERALIVYYRVSRSDIEPAYGDNKMILVNLVAAVKTLLESPDSEISRIVVAGFASPEGTFDFNDRLAWERAVSVKEYIMQNTGIRGDVISLYNGSEDWRGLRAMVAASDLYDREQILRIVDTVPIISTDGRRKLRLEQIQALNGGRSYRYMLENFFPKLRNGAFIRVYYGEKQDG